MKLLENLPIQRKLMTAFLLISGVVLLLTCTSFFAYEFITFRRSKIREIYTLGRIVASNSTAAVAFDDRQAANEILTALQAEKHIVVAGIYDLQGNVFSRYPDTVSFANFPILPERTGYRFERSHLEGFQPVKQGEMLLGTLYIKSDLGAMYERLRLYAIISIAVIIISFLLAYLLSTILQRRISRPILALAKTARIVSDKRDYSVRTPVQENDEVGSLTRAFNNMLAQIQEQDQTLSEFNKKLLKRNEELRKTNEDLDNFVYAASHDLKSPIVNIAGVFQLLTEEINGDNMERKDLVEKINHSIEQLKRTITGLSIAARAQKNIYDDVEDVNFNDILEDVKVDIESMITSSGAEIEADFKDVPSQHYSRAAMKSVIYNLLSNAIKYKSPDRKPVIKIGTEKKDGNTVLYVKDNGLGIDLNKDKDKLFKIFKRLHDHVEGTGIGLYAIKKIVENNGGRIEVESELDKGSEFRVYFS